MLLTGLFYIIIPLFLIAMLALNRQPGRLQWILTVLAFGLVIANMWATARWELVGVYLKNTFLLLYLIACVVGYTRIQKPSKPQNKLAVVFGLSVNVVLIIFMSGLNWFTFRGYAAPAETVDLMSPLRNQQYMVLHGGASPFINAHFHVRPQTYALDIVGLNRLGMRSASIAGGSQLEDYVIYDAPVFSPCTGTVALAVDQFEDLIPPHTDPEHLAGNHVLIACDGMEILLAHLKKGSVVVHAGERVTTNSVLGRVGNSGNTSEPHLHMHVETGGEPMTILKGEAVPFTLNSQFLVRGRIIEP
ncbi:MAG: M23 family metallopeptidase [Chloroflexi bacterium]|nr:M23 family metallopeptidase [Chloroflexota bacterium]